MSLQKSASDHGPVAVLSAAGTSSLTLAINGSEFITSSSVAFKGMPDTPRFVSSSHLAIPLSASDLATAGTFAVTVTNPLPGGGTSSAANFSVTSCTVLHSFNRTDGATPNARVILTNDE